MRWRAVAEEEEMEGEYAESMATMGLDFLKP